MRKFGATRDFQIQSISYCLFILVIISSGIALRLTLQVVRLFDNWEWRGYGITPQLFWSGVRRRFSLYWGEFMLVMENLFVPSHGETVVLTASWWNTPPSSSTSSSGLAIPPLLSSHSLLTLERSGGAASTLELTFVYGSLGSLVIDADV